MIEFYIVLIVVLFALAISDLVVGVSNDAVNFLNSAIGSKAAPKWLIFGVASLGVLAGSMFSSGMMEIARKGIFHPEMFAFQEIMYIFLAVMITDVILLDIFNTFGFPTSTTVSIVFELLGSAVAVAVVKMNMLGENASELSKYINSDKALAIITGILLSVVVAFSIGAIVQWITRLIFSFRYANTLKWFGAIYGGLATAAITYFILIKGAKGASFMSAETVEMIKTNMWTIILASFGFWTVFMQLINWIFKVNILKVVVLIGTFALAMAFAGNDLVNFIGVPLAGFASFKEWAAQTAFSSGSFWDWVKDGMPVVQDMPMTMLKEKVKTETYMLVIAGVIMIVTLIFSKKAQRVVKTTVDLSRQDEGDERFNSSAAARIIVRSAVNTSNRFHKYVPAPIVARVQKQFEQVALEDARSDEDRAAFDLVRAATNLVVASILISIGTSLKLPLSTTYVTFMVAMGTSLADKAWGRDSAVYRISGVFNVIGGWFLTAFVAFLFAFFVALLIVWGGALSLLILVCLAIFLLIRSQLSFKSKNSTTSENDEEIVEPFVNATKVLEKSKKSTIKSLITTSRAVQVGLKGFFESDRTQLKTAIADTRDFDARSKRIRENLYKNMQRLQKDSVDTGHYYVQVLDYQREMSHSLSHIIDPMYRHFDNNHNPLSETQIEELQIVSTALDNLFNFALHILKEERFNEVDELIEMRDETVKHLEALTKAQIKRVRDGKIKSSKNSILFFNIISETKNLLMNTINLIKSERDFVQHTREMV